MSLSPQQKSAAIEARANERSISLRQAAQELSLACLARKSHISSTVRGLTVCGLSSYSMDCVEPQEPSAATCKRCRRYLPG